MKKFFSILAMMAICFSMPVLTSCSDDEEDGPSGDALMEQLEGTWYFEQMTVSIPALNQSITMDLEDLKNSSDYDAMYDEVLTFRGNKVVGYDGKEHTYEVSGNSILLPWYKDSNWWQEISFSGSNYMTMYLKVNESGYDIEMWFDYRKSGSRAAVVAPTDVQIRSLVKGALKQIK